MVIQPILRSIDIKCHMTIHMLLDSKTPQSIPLFLLPLLVFHAIFSFYLNHHLMYFIFKMTHYACITIWVISSCLIGSHCTIHTSTIYCTYKAIRLSVYSLLKNLWRQVCVSIHHARSCDHTDLIVLQTIGNSMDLFSVMR
jgi:hypothetical protein